jgi:hypothetical protein
LSLTAFSAAVSAQNTSPTPRNKKAEAETKRAANRTSNQPVTAESIVESSIVIYGGLGGRKTLDQIRKTSIERGKMSVINAQGQSEPVNYRRWTVRGENLDKEKIRLDQEFPATRFALVRADEKTFGIFNESSFSPRADATKEFENRIFHGLEALLRYKENGSTIALAGQDKILGVDFHFIDVTDKAGRKTRFYISSKLFRVMMLEYEEDGVKYRRKFYDYRYAQGTLVPFRTTLTAGDKLIEETQVLTVTFGQKVEDDLFKITS